jgi:hypothetical protein
MHLEPNWTVLYDIWRTLALDRNTEQGKNCESGDRSWVTAEM